ncbi:Gfo/Idh/MocA family oxidoreductase [Haladaptatus sp. T7]|uniref:Gfo/Idh/MocA family protein n=1 Tax=Haladaptatus sp. T7 TaxID=2029368 RepID=UPI0021A25886|nr:Gfo/Idh/MocA family oxidoreductase [Haladaptatus sp. T7]GKZ14410.1 oxidoreductase [Haladaptatus sp. T7]
MKFGVISTAKIGVNAVIPAIKEAGHEVTALASRSESRAATVAEQLDIPHTYGTYEGLLEDDEIEAVYNPLPNALHAEWTKRAADHGHHILCEKPLAVNAAEARETSTYCDERGVTLMEAFMYRYHPRTQRAVEIARKLDIRSLKASLRFSLDDPEDVRLDPNLAGGSLMDVGCYTVNATRLFLGEPRRVYATATDTMDCGVETELTAILEYEDGVTAVISSGFTTVGTERYRIEATNGWIEAPDAFVPSKDDETELTYRIDDRHVVEEFDPTNQYAREVDHFVESIQNGRPPVTDATDATRTLQLIDAIRESAHEREPISL